MQLSEIEAKDVEWLWHPYIPLGMLTMLNGDPGVGKSFVAISICASLTSGSMPYTYEHCQPSNVLYLTIENPAAEVLRPRFDHMQGDASRFYLLEGSITGPDGDRATHGAVTLADVVLLEDALTRTQAKLVVVDPLQSYLGADIDMFRANETRPVLDNLFRLAQKYHCAILILRHGTKQRHGRAIHNGIGSIDFTGAVRSELLAGTDASDFTRKAMAHIKTNVGPTGDVLGYEIDHQGRFRWKNADGMTVAAMLKPETDPEDKSAVDDAVDFLKQALGNGPRPAKEVIKDAREFLITEITLRRAKKQLRIESSQLPPKLDQKKGGGGWEWRLPS